MSQYTTGEIAKLTGITVRTVQYYDSRGILMPSDFSEGGRRLYNDEDLKKLRIICFMRDLDISINNISEILEAENSEKIISVMLEQKLALVQEELAEQEKRRDTLLTIQKEMKHYNHFSIDHLGDIAQQMKSKKQLRKIRAIILAVGIPLEIIEVATFMLGLLNGIWWPYLMGLVLMILGSIFIVPYYYKMISFICPECHMVFRPGFKEWSFANHTPTTRKLRCPGCGNHGYCVETYQPQEEEKYE